MRKRRESTHALNPAKHRRLERGLVEPTSQWLGDMPTDCFAKKAASNVTKKQLVRSTLMDDADEVAIEIRIPTRKAAHGLLLMTVPCLLGSIGFRRCPRKLATRFQHVRQLSEPSRMCRRNDVSQQRPRPTRNIW